MITWLRRVRNEWRRKERQQKFYALFIQPSSLVFDIGANHGQYARFFLDLGAHVVAAEPQPSCWSDLEKIGDTSTKFILVKSALGAADGTAKLHIGNMDEVSSLSSEFREAYSRYPY
ncbi:MAG: FkbM family methyltransferase, partial [Bacteroidia bacterium]